MSKMIKIDCMIIVWKY